MSAKLQIISRVRRLMDYITDIEAGLIQVPGFQRDFVWTISDMLELFNSLKMGYPIGTILLWKPGKSYGEVISIGPYNVPERPENFFYVLDGFQRISTLFGCLVNPRKTTLIVDRELLKNFRIYYDLKMEEFAAQRGGTLEYYQIPVYMLIDNKETFLWQRKLFDKADEEIELLLERYEQIGNTLLSFNLPSIDIIGGEVEEAIDIFWRLNSKGSIISPDWIVSARTYDMNEGFRLGTEIDKLLQELRPYNYDTIKREVILQCIQSSFGKIYFEMRTEEMVRREDFRENTFKTLESIKRAVRFLYEELLVVDSRLLPANIQLVFITEFFNRIEFPLESQLEKLKRWFWQTTYSNYFTVLSPSKRKDAFNHFISILETDEEGLLFNDRPDIPFVIGDFPSRIYLGSVRAKALVLFLLNYSNNFKKILFDDVDGVNLSYLFYPIRNGNGDLAASALVPILISKQRDTVKTPDVSFMLKEWKEAYVKYFIMKEMVDLYLENKFTAIIELREKEIIIEEKKFVEFLGLVYEDSSLSVSNS